MGIASSMKGLVESIASSHQDRTKTLMKIGEEARHATGDARATIKDFQTARKEAGAELRIALAGDRASRKRDVRRVLGDAQGLVKGLHASRWKDSSQLRKKLVRMATELRSEVSTILGDARHVVGAFQTQRKEAGAKLREELARSRSSRESEVKALTGDARDLVKGFAESREEAGRTLRKDLARGRADRVSAAKAMRAEDNELRAGLRKSRAGVRGEINEARDAWQELTRRKTAKKPAVEAEAAEAAPGEEGHGLEARLLAAINDHPRGITLTEVAESLGVAPIVFGRAARKLVDGGKVRKEDKAYFPVASR